MTLLVLSTLPAQVALTRPAPLTPWDAVFAVAFLAFLTGETVADQQQWNFHRRKAAGEASGVGFLGGALNWTVVGPVLLTVLFIGSTIFTESISASRYPEYAQYRRTTSMIVPLPPRGAPERAAA